MEYKNNHPELSASLSTHTKTTCSSNADKSSQAILVSPVINPGIKFSRPPATSTKESTSPKHELWPINSMFLFCPRRRSQESSATSLDRKSDMKSDHSKRNRATSTQSTEPKSKSPRPSNISTPSTLQLPSHTPRRRKANLRLEYRGPPKTNHPTSPQTTADQGPAVGKLPNRSSTENQSAAKISTPLAATLKNQPTTE